MKIIILISSIFYILGLKISNKIDLVKKSNPVEKIITHKTKTAEPEDAAKYEEEADKTSPTTEKNVLSTPLPILWNNNIRSKKFIDVNRG
ncbi:MAG TPA: hypothetical protein VEP89_02425 [Draconibacterium sp.]|nr:hypothetical protein [Draconibacterium sp.]